MKDCELNRLDYLILQVLNVSNSMDYYSGITIAEIIEQGVTGTRLTIYRKLQNLVKNGYISKGILDDHADTYYLNDKAIKILGGKE